ncbi:ATPase [Soonwooa sp.]|uniref:ATPase n=1 Tax=Soonwooa sp. TaxID=1938592 RepID=UPI00289AE3B2|nr:ATPase [Soonwooa sp.]
MKLPTKEIQMRYDYSKIMPWFRRKASRFLGKEYYITEEEKSILFATIAYMLNDDLVAKEMNFDLNKGILLSGPIGCGKTSLFKILRYCKFPRAKYNIVSTRSVVTEFIRDGYPVLEKYTNAVAIGELVSPKTYCFDDLGVEAASKFYGNDCNVMAEILLTRYDLFVEKKLLTHVTTNLTASEIEHQYGNRLRSRMREMFNVFGFDNFVEDKRK